MFLYKFSKHAGESVQTSDPEELTTALKYLKDHYAYLAIFTIIGMAVYGLAIVIIALVALLK
jgi:hypothetical protein